MPKPEFIVRLSQKGKNGFYSQWAKDHFSEEFPDAFRTHSIKMAKDVAKVRVGSKVAEAAEVWQDYGMANETVVFRV